MITKATAVANSNIAFIKYWGNIDDALRIPQNSSISMTLDGLFTRTTVEWENTQHEDILTINGEIASPIAQQRVQHFLSQIRQRYGVTGYATVTSENNFPMGVGIASSASSFAALAKAATASAGLSLEERELTTVARLGSGSASRSISEGYVKWHQGDSHETSFAESIAGQAHWALTDLIVVADEKHKKYGSTQGHTLAQTSDLQAGRLTHIGERVAAVEMAIQKRDFELLAKTAELDSNLMHAVMMTSNPALFYWQPLSLRIMDTVRILREEKGYAVFYTLDAGPNVHCVVSEQDIEPVKAALLQIPDVKTVIQARVGRGAYIADNNS